MSFWKPQKSYPTDAIHTVTIKATAGQRERWEAAAKRWRRNSSRGAYIAFAADFLAHFLEALDKAGEDWTWMMHDGR